MNIFRLSDDPRKAAKWHCDKHVNKMLTEAAQLMSTAMRRNGYDYGWLYLPTHTGHPLHQWVAEGRQNFRYVKELAEGLFSEKKLRWGGTHRAYVKVVSKLPFEPGEFPEGETRQYCAMPDEYVVDDPVESYRDYYVNEKLTWGHYELAEEVPPWVNDYRL